MGKSAPTSLQIQQLRDAAAACLNDAVHCSDPARRDALVREALALLDQARAPQDPAASEPQNDGTRRNGVHG